jgi:acyl-ACP thioesterase
LDATTRRPARQVEIPSDTPKGLVPLFENAFSKIRLPKESQPTYSVHLTAQRDDIDQNHHVNNGRYMAWAMESYAKDFIQSHDIVHIDAHFKNECFAGTIVLSEAFKLSDEDGQTVFLHRIMNKNNQIDLCHLRFIWKNHS